MTKRFLMVMGMLVASGILLCVSLPSLAASYQEQEVEAAFVFNFAKFVDWPADAFERSDSAIVIGLVGEDPLGSTLNQLIAGKEINGRRFAIRRMQWNDELKNRQIVFIGSSDRGRARRFIERAKGFPVLTIGGMPGLAKQGAVINFVVEQGHVRFEINPDAAKRARLSISSRLLSLARIVTDSQDGRG